MFGLKMCLDEETGRLLITRSDVAFESRDKQCVGQTNRPRKGRSMRFGMSMPNDRTEPPKRLRSTIRIEEFIWDSDEEG